ncbi:IS66 family transposase, partial [Escherichia coli]|uniref:IS66 family transposase n=18 Tax=Enterobacteriaceae TaxID=543 RepID=UPI000A4D01F5
MQKNVTPGRRKGSPNYPPEFKQQLVAASCEPGISISKLALENGINANLLFKWRQQWREGKLLLPSSESPQLLPVTLDAAAEQPESLAEDPKTLSISCEVTFRHGTLRFNGNVSEKLLTVTNGAIVIRTERVKKACTKCDCIVEAPAPSRPIERGIASSGLLARVLTGKYCEHLPLYRQSEIFARQGVELSRALLSNWVDACCQLMTPLNDALYRYVMNTRKLHTDDTPVKVLAPGLKKTKTGRIWTYVRDDRNAGSSSPPAVWFAYSSNRQGKHPEQHLRPFRGILQADAFTGYDRLFSAEREGSALTEVACWAHARRKIHDVYISSKSATAEEALKRISELYAIEDEIRGLPESERLAARQQRSKALLTSLHEWMVEKNGPLSKKSRLGEAFSYVLNQW